VIVEYLVADQFGSHIGKYSERLEITHAKQTLMQAPLLHLKAVYINSRGVSISSDAIEACCERGIPILFVNQRGNSYASLYASGLTGTVLTRRAQLLAYNNDKGRTFALTIAAAKIRNQSVTLKYLAKNRKETQPELYQELQLRAGEVLDSVAQLERLQGECVDDIRQHILAVEGNAARRYWSAVALLMPEQYDWPGREGRGANDPLNSLLNYGYGILYGQLEQALILAGLDPYAGFLHADRPGKPSLVLDFIEEFRQVAIDRLIFGLANREFNVVQDDRGKLDEDTRRALADKVLKHLEATVRYDGKRFPLRYVIQNQARCLASYFRGDREDYQPFQATW
jgi:CRISPR-associated protein Cas1